MKRIIYLLLALALLVGCGCSSNCTTEHPASKSGPPTVEDCDALLRKGIDGAQSSMWKRTYAGLATACYLSLDAERGASEIPELEDCERITKTRLFTHTKPLEDMQTIKHRYRAEQWLFRCRERNENRKANTDGVASQTFDVPHPLTIEELQVFSTLGKDKDK